MGGRIDLAGQVFGRLEVLRKAPSQRRCSFWLCRCACGTTKAVMTQSLRSGLTQSCGCLMRESSAALGSKANLRHGMRHSVEYSVWSGILRRCRNPNEKSFPRYGGRGIACRFRSFEEFYAEVGPRPSAQHQIDRIDVNGHYERGNVRWVLEPAQRINKRNTLMVEIHGRKLPLRAACEEHGANYKLAWERLKRGWSPERAIGVV